MSPFAGRTLTLSLPGPAFDGAALGAAGLWTNRIVLSLIGTRHLPLIGFGASLLALVPPRLEEIAVARSALRDEVKEMQRLLRRGER